MRPILLGTMLTIVTLPALALVEGNQVAYVSGTTTTLKAGATGTLETTDPADLVFNSPEGVLRIPYDRMSHVEYHTDVARHLGVLGAIAVGMVRKRERKHFLEVAYRDKFDAVQLVQFELAKGVSVSLLPVLKARAPQACSAKFPNNGCTVSRTYGP